MNIIRLVRTLFKSDKSDTEKALDDPREYIRMNAYDQLGYTEKAFNDSDSKIRMEAYDRLGYTEKSLTDKKPEIRLEAYRELGFSTNAYYDTWVYIRLEAYMSLDNIHMGKTDPLEKIRNGITIYLNRINMDDTRNPVFDDLKLYCEV